MGEKSDKELAVELARTFISVFTRQPGAEPIKSEDLTAILQNAYKAVKSLERMP